MKIFKLMVVALVAMFGFIACDKHECNDHNHSADLVGTWTCLQEGYAEALVIKADGSAVSTPPISCHSDYSNRHYILQVVTVTLP